MRIGEAAAAAGMTAKTLRFYGECGLLPVAARATNEWVFANERFTPVKAAFNGTVLAEAPQDELIKHSGKKYRSRCSSVFWRSGMPHPSSEECGLFASQAARKWVRTSESCVSQIAEFAPARPLSSWQ